MANVHRPGESSPWDMLLALPPVTRNYLVLSVASMLLTHFRVLPMRWFFFNWQYMLKTGAFQTLVLNFFHFGELSFQLLIWLMSFYQHSLALELGTFHSDTADYFFFLIFAGGILLLLDAIVPSLQLSLGLVFAVMQLDCRENAERITKLLFFFSGKALYVPICNVALMFVISGGGIPWVAINGIIAGHLYYFLTRVVPTMPNGRELLRTPEQFRKMVEYVSSAASAGSASVRERLSTVGGPPQTATTGRASSSYAGRQSSAEGGAGAGGSSSAANLRNRFASTTSSGTSRTTAGTRNWGEGRRLGD